jgi:orotidine-5'-phosphate decarboxylase
VAETEPLRSAAGASATPQRGAAPTPPSFADRLVRALRAHGHPLCLGLDPHLELLPEPFREGSLRPADPRSAAAVERFGLAVLERAAAHVAVVKPQIACFEQLGWPGLRALTQLCARARELGLLVLLDAKRADIASSAEGYARAYLEPESPLPVDAITASPYLGSDALEPFAARARAHGRGCFVLVATSNPGGRELQDLRLASGETVAERVAAQLRPLCDELAGPETGWSSLGAVVGATRPELALRLRQRLPRALFLVPGFGSQGGAAREAVRGFVPGPAGLEGGLVNASRSILFGGTPESTARAWESGFDARLARHIELLGEAIRAGA